MSLFLTKEYEKLESVYGLTKERETFKYLAYSDHKAKVLMTGYLNQPDWARRRILREYINDLSFQIENRANHVGRRSMPQATINALDKDVVNARHHQAYWLARLRKIGRAIPYSAITSK